VDQAGQGQVAPSPGQVLEAEATPSRSRFGCLLEGAFYELVFQNGPERPFPRSAAMRKALFHVQINTHRGLRLQQQRSRALQARLRDPVNSGFCQGVGADC